MADQFPQTQQKRATMWRVWGNTGWVKGETVVQCNLIQHRNRKFCVPSLGTGLLAQTCVGWPRVVSTFNGSRGFHSECHFHGLAAGSRVQEGGFRTGLLCRPVGCSCCGCSRGACQARVSRGGFQKEKGRRAHRDFCSRRTRCRQRHAVCAFGGRVRLCAFKVPWIPCRAPTLVVSCHHVMFASKSCMLCP